MTKQFNILLFLMFWCITGHTKCVDVSEQQVADILNMPKLSSLISLEVADCESVRLSNNTIDFILRPDTKKTHNGIRAEVAVDYPFKELEKVTYQFEVKIPKDFKADHPKNRWWLITQWHDQPDKTKGETWKSFPPRSPPVAVYIEERNGITGFGIITFGRKKESWFPYPLGDWLTFNFNIVWSTNQDGVVDFKVLERPEYDHVVYGSNMYNTYQHYFKVGQYRHPKIETTNKVTFRNFTIFKSYKNQN